MLVDATLTGRSPDELAVQARAFEAAGYAGAWSSEVAHDPFLQLLPAAIATTRVELGTAIAVAFARTPMTVAYAAHDLQTYSEGRFVLGLGSQVKAHVERRFGMPWHRPAERMREFVCALRAIWDAWATGARLDFRGDFYVHTLMTPFFSPPPEPWGPPPIHLAAVGPRMTQVAGEVADGLLVHPFTTRAYLLERTLPAVEQARHAAGRTGSGFAICVSALVASGTTERELAAAVEAVRAQIAFYGSTPAYRVVLEQHGWGRLGDDLHRISRSADDDRWERMQELIDDEILSTFAVVAEAEHLGDAILERFGGIADRFSFSLPYRHSPELLAPAVETLRAASPAATSASEAEGAG